MIEIEGAGESSVRGGSLGNAALVGHGLDVARSSALERAVQHYGARPNAQPSPAQVVEMAQAFLDFLKTRQPAKTRR